MQAVMKSLDGYVQGGSGGCGTGERLIAHLDATAAEQTFGSPQRREEYWRDVPIGQFSDDLIALNSALRGVSKETCEFMPKGFMGVQFDDANAPADGIPRTVRLVGAGPARRQELFEATFATAQKIPSIHDAATLSSLNIVALQCLQEGHSRTVAAMYSLATYGWRGDDQDRAYYRYLFAGGDSPRSNHCFPLNLHPNRLQLPARFGREATRQTLKWHGMDDRHVDTISNTALPDLLPECYTGKAVHPAQHQSPNKLAAFILGNPGFNLPVALRFIAHCRPRDLEAIRAHKGENPYAIDAAELIGHMEQSDMQWLLMHHDNLTAAYVNEMIRTFSSGESHVFGPARAIVDYYRPSPHSC